ncbi:exocyst complex component SEC8 [Arachis stenosperma]|uniref:exocyst complex component SEC8 n=1 Tax=Arachis stenosperma TaxID=217475 RepID=UPI0025AB8043|nr:exocyst complex component SEC8 [Arachis stenosperma]XP_057733624.1 exocyst complex component SEC8 [Arachis stenosperma]XP_057733625.1 exocyst complex component SEC8 [Arachis stenosperma]
MGLFDDLPLPEDKAYLRRELAKIDESWTVARFDSLPHVVHILTSKDRDAAAQLLKEQSDVVEEVVDEVVQTYHSGFNKAIQNYSQILKLFSDSTESISVLKVDLAEAKKHLSARNKQLHQLWYRSVTLRHIISLLDQIEGIAKVPARIEELIAEKQFYAAVQLQVQSMLMLEREGLQTVGALQDVRSELTKLRGALFYKILEDLHAHLYNKGEYSAAGSTMLENDDEVPTTTAVALTAHNSQPLSRRTRLLKGDTQTALQVDGSYKPGSVDGGFDGHDGEGTLESNGSDVPKDATIALHEMPTWLSNSTPDEFLETIRKSDAPLHVKYLQTLVECLCMLGKVAAAGAVICQRLRPTIHEVIMSKIKAHAELLNSSASSQDSRVGTGGLHFIKGQLESYQMPKKKRKNGIFVNGTLLAVSPVSPLMVPGGKAQVAAKELLDSILDAVVRIFENHVIVGELLEAKASHHVEINTPKSMSVDVNWNPESEASQVTGGYSIGFSLTVLQSECQQLLCEILRATPEAASADAAVQTARLASKAPSKDKRDKSEDGLTFAFRFTDATISVPNQGADLIRQGWNRKGPNVLQEGYGSAAVLPEEGIYLAAAIYRPVHQFTDKVASMLPTKYSQLGNDGLLAFVENFVKDHFLPTMFVDYRKGVQQAISSPAAFRPRAHLAAYTPSIEKGRPVLQGLLAIDHLTKEVLGWAQAMPKFASDLVKYVETFLERTYERCRASYMEAVLEKQSYMLIGRHDIEKLMRLDPSSAYLPNLLDQSNMQTNSSDAETIEAELELSEQLLRLCPIKQENLIHDGNKLILLASLSDSLEYVADSIERLGQATQSSNHVEGNYHHARSDSAPPRTLASFAQDYRKLAVDCLKVLRVEMQLTTVFHIQDMGSKTYLDDQDAEEPDDFIIALTSLITERDEEIAPFVSNAKRSYIFGGICFVAAHKFIQALGDMDSINLFGVQQICRNSIALEQALAAIPSIDSEAVQQRLDRVRTYYELLNMPFEALLSFITEHVHLFSASQYAKLLKVQVPGREIPPDGRDRISELLSL